LRCHVLDRIKCESLAKEFQQIADTAAITDRDVELALAQEVANRRVELLGDVFDREQRRLLRCRRFLLGLRGR
jgi:hypothetical protein